MDAVAVVLNYEHAGFDIVSDFGQFYKIRRYSDTFSATTVTDFTTVSPESGPAPVLTALPSKAKPEKVIE
ncbi:hypothetical protein D1AOALGA4SA_6970 [Olavius algarvensis Delta 1 endosymbiont]|nr:hypothetical protein D1AOALGA4SA_6970 [Olavius algarvensis Delta 1 endosymbiont]